MAAAALLTACASSPTAHSASLIDNADVTTLSMTSPNAYTPHAQSGGTDDYHCTLLNPHVKQDSFIVASQFFPGTGPSTVEVHHAILFLVPPGLVSAARRPMTGVRAGHASASHPFSAAGWVSF